MKKKTGKMGKGFTLAACALAAAICMGCGAADGTANGTVMSSGSIYDGSASYSEAVSNMAGGSFSDSAGSFQSESAQASGSGAVMDITVGRKLVKTVDLEIETKEFEQMMSALEEQIQNIGGYIEKMDAYNGSGYSNYSSCRYANLTIRIPAEQLNGFLKNVSGIGNIVRRYDNVDDVTLSYVDMEGRRDTLQTEQSRLLAFLERADSIEDILTIEERLSNVRYQLESMESQLRAMDNLLEYSTVNLNITEVKELSPIAEQTVWERIAEGFSDSVRNIGDGVVNFGIWLIVRIPYFVIWTAVIAVIVLIIRRVYRKRCRKKESMEQ